MLPKGVAPPPPAQPGLPHCTGICLCRKPLELRPHALPIPAPSFLQPRPAPVGRESRRGRCLLESFPPIADPPPPVPGSHSCDRVFLPQLGPLICVSISSVSSHRPLGRCFLPAKHDECSLPELGHLWSVGRRALAKQSPLPVHYSHKPDSQRRSTS